MVIPLVIFGMKALAKLQVWTTPLWLVLFVIPMVYLLIKHPDAVEGFFTHFPRPGRHQRARVSPR